MDKKQATRTGKEREQNNVAEPLAHPHAQAVRYASGRRHEQGRETPLPSHKRIEANPDPVIVEETLDV